MNDWLMCDRWMGDEWGWMNTNSVCFLWIKKKKEIWEKTWFNYQNWPRWDPSGCFKAHMPIIISDSISVLYNSYLNEKCFLRFGSFHLSVQIQEKMLGYILHLPSFISFLIMISKLFEAGIFVYLSKNYILSDSQYEFQSSSPSANALTVITHRVIQALHDKPGD